MVYGRVKSEATVSSNQFSQKSRLLNDGSLLISDLTATYSLGSNNYTKVKYTIPNTFVGDLVEIGDWFVTTSQRNDNIHIRNESSGDLIHTIDRNKVGYHRFAASCLAFAYGSVFAPGYFASGADDFSIKIWSLN